jgi:hypothetical protein
MGDTEKSSPYKEIISHFSIGSDPILYPPARITVLAPARVVWLLGNKYRLKEKTEMTKILEKLL